MDRRTKAQLVEIDLRYKRRARRKTSLLALRLRDINKLLRARYGETLPDDDAGRDDVRIVAHHLAGILTSNPVHRIAEWCRLRAPWLSIRELDQITRDAIARPRRWRADKLAWRLRLTAADRATLKITTIGAIDANKAQRAAQRRAQARKRQEARRRAAGATPRQSYEAASTARAKPWETLKMSRRSWYRKGKPAVPT